MGLRREKYAHRWEDNQVAEPLLQGLDALDNLDASFSESSGSHNR